VAANPTPQLLKQLRDETIQALPQIFDAFMILTIPEHRPIIYQLFKSIGNLLRSICAKQTLNMNATQE
jgi:hypothetical protein